MSCSVSSPKAIEFRSDLGFKQHDIVLSKEQSVMSKITKLRKYCYNIVFVFS